MRRRAFIWVVLCAMALSLGGCVLGHDMKTDEPVELRCRPVMSPGLRGADVANQMTSGFDQLFPAEANIGLWAYSLPRDKQWEIFSPDAEKFLPVTTFTHNPEDGLWYPPTSVDWKYSASLTILAYAPREQAVSFDKKRGLIVENYDSEAKHNIDLMYTDFLADLHCENNRQGVYLPFYHALAAVDVKVSTTLTIPGSIAIRGVYLEQITTRGDFFSHPDPVWYPAEEKQTVALYTNDAEGWVLPQNNGEVISGSTRYLIPQMGLTRVVVVADVMQGGMIAPEQRFVTDDVRFLWEPGRHYTYTLNITAKSLHFEEPNPEEYQ